MLSSLAPLGPLLDELQAESPPGGSFSAHLIKNDKKIMIASSIF
jgi:hypothetical protein